MLEGLGAGGEGDDRGWDGWMASPTRWTWVWVNSGSWWWTGRPGMLWFMGSQRVGHDWATKLNWKLRWKFIFQIASALFIILSLIVIKYYIQKDVQYCQVNSLGSEKGHATSMSSSNCCFLTCIQISQEASQVVCYSYLFQNFPVCCDPHSQRLWQSQ